MLQENKNKNALKKHLRGKKSHLFAYLTLLYFLWARRKENTKKRKVPTMLSIGAVCWCIRPVWTH